MKIENVYVFGIGAAGSNVFMNLLYAFPSLNFTVVDFDIIENRNFENGTQPYTKADLKRPKTQALQRISMINKNVKIISINKKIESKKDIEGIVKETKNSLIIDSFDNAKSRNLFLKLNKSYNVIHVGFSGQLTGEAVWNEVFEKMEEAKSDNDIDVCEMAIARPFIMSLTGMTSIVIANFIENGKKENVYFDKSLITKRF
jgi:hypothetical protein